MWAGVKRAPGCPPPAPLHPPAPHPHASHPCPPTHTHTLPPPPPTPLWCVVAGLSHDFGRFRREANLCLAEFAALFGGSPLRDVPVDWSLGGPPNCALGPLGCIYL